MAAAACVMASAGCGGEPAYPAELLGSHDVTGRHYCEYVIDGHTEVMLDYEPTIRFWGESDDVDCEPGVEIFIESRPNPSGGICARETSDNGVVWRASVRPSVFLPAPDVTPSFYSSEVGLGIWNLSGNVEYTGTLTYDRTDRTLTLDIEGSGDAGPLSTYMGRGTVHCVYDATVEP
jgi:hypothetical protein